MKLSNLIISVCMVSLFSIAAIFFVAYKYIAVRFNYPVLSEYKSFGIDVSHHQGVIDWVVLSKSHLDFAYIKATEGGDWKDSAFERNVWAAKNAGIKVGTYHFFTLCKDGKTQAKNFVEATKHIDLDLPMAIDLEYVGNCKNRPNKNTFEKELKFFLQTLDQDTKENIIFYTTYSFYHDYLKGTGYESYPIWMRDIFGEPDIKKYPSVIMWQFADNARLEGIKGPVDLNVFLTPK